MNRSRRAATIAAAACLAAPALLSLGSADAAPAIRATTTAGDDDAFTRIDVDSQIGGASFTTVGEVFGSERDVVTSSYGSLDAAGRPVGGGSLQVYRPGRDLREWTKVAVFGPDAGIVFPNATTVDDVDGDGDNDIVVPSGYFFGTDPAAPSNLNTTGAITWWENHGAGSAFTRHEVISGQAASYHGVQLVDLDGDGLKDLVSVAEEAKAAGDLTDDEVRTQFFKGNPDHTFEAPTALAEGVGGSQPVVYDVDGDHDLDIITSQYFRTFNHDAFGAGFLWLENGDEDGALTGSDFTKHTIASVFGDESGRGVGMGFQIRPVPDFREPGKVSWIGTNHVNRCTFGQILPIPEQVFEFVPGDDIREQWTPVTLSDPVTPGPACPTPYNSGYTTFSDQITARAGYGQGAPGVFGYGDLDGDGDVDLAVSGDGDRRLWWIENGGDGTTALHQLTADGEVFGQSGGAAVVDLDGDGTNELVFSSFDQNTLAIWTPEKLTAPETVASKLKADSTVRVKAGRKARIGLKLTSAPAGPRRTVKVTFDPRKGRTVSLGTVRLGPGGASVQKGTFTWKAKKEKKAGRLIFVYAGSTITDLLSDTATRTTVKVVIKKAKRK